MPCCKILPLAICIAWKIPSQQGRRGNPVTGALFSLLIGRIDESADADSEDGWSLGSSHQNQVQDYTNKKQKQAKSNAEDFGVVEPEYAFSWLLAASLDCMSFHTARFSLSNTELDKKKKWYNW
jgi:hypothetical protein